MGIKMFDMVKTLVDKENIKFNCVGAVVEIWATNGPYEVEFVEEHTGRTTALLTMNHDEIDIINGVYKEGEPN